MSAAPRTALIVHADAPQLPFIATALGTRFTALARNGWSVVLVPDELDPGALAAAADPDAMAVLISSDGESRSLRIYPPVNSLNARESWSAQFARIADDSTLRWEPAESATDLALEALRGQASPVPTAQPAREAQDTNGALDFSGAPDTVSAAGADDAASSPAAGTAEARMLTTVEFIASLTELDAAATARLENYARTPSSGLLLESVLQLLGLPTVAAKLVESQRELHEVDGVSDFEPRPLGLSMLAAASVEPSGGDVLSRIQRAYVRRPGLLLAIGGAEIALGAGLAGLAARGGRRAAVLGSASAALFTDAALQAALWASVRARKNR
ncbi:hypothetical protein M3694_08045 [Kocuria marina]|uniref:hypothetical protein n=1 Tax=Kocuria marina TaxID=223184 RepID=UPI00298A0757|nr:hypothetical protein [Kocuria marina]MCT2361678.1 hypothetical protein [Kocuria marina]